jgi:hypothetical protein
MWQRAADGSLLSARGRSVQEQCGFEEGELRCIFVESQPLGRATMEYRIVDARTGLLEAGEVDVQTMRRRQPWQAGVAEDLGHAARKPPSTEMGAPVT